MVNQMVQEGFHKAKEHLDEIRNDIERQRLELLQERELIEAKIAEHAFEQ